MKKGLQLIIILALSFIAFNSCRKDKASEQYKGTVTQPTKSDLGTTVTTNVTGFVTDENNHAVTGATVTAGSIITTTDSFGYFTIKNAVVPKIAGEVKVVYPGYFTGYKTFICTPSNSMFTRVKLMPKINAGNITALTGGGVTSTDGAQVTLPAGGVVIAAGGGAYSGSVHVAVHWINPTDLNALTLNMPGDLRGIDSANNIQGLNSYGMLAVELTGDAGQLLQIAEGKLATLSFPIPSSLLASAPATIPLWSFNDTTGLWKEEGFATKVGNNYVGNVAHFSYWNCDQPFDGGVTLQTQLVDSALHPLANATVEIISQAGVYTGCHGYTDSLGYISGYVPANSSLQLNTVVAPCYSSTYTKNFSTVTTNVDLGTLAVNSTQLSLYTINGTVVSCSNVPVSDGIVILMPSDNSGFISVPLQSNGNFSFSPVSCPNVTYSIAAIDNTDILTSTIQPLTLTPGINNIGLIDVCSPGNLSSISYTLDGHTTILIEPFYEGGIILGDASQGNSDTSVVVNHLGFQFKSVDYPNSGGIFAMEDAPISTGSDPYYAGIIDDYVSSFPAIDYTYYPDGYLWGGGAFPPITITHFGNVGDFIIGSFNETIQRVPDSSTHTISVSFKLRRLL